MTDLPALTQALESLVTLIQAGGALGGAVAMGLFVVWMVRQLKGRASRKGDPKSDGAVHRHLRRLDERITEHERAHGEIMRQLVRDTQGLTESVRELVKEVASMRREQAVFQAHQEARTG